MTEPKDIPADWWVAQDSDAAWQRQMEQSRYEAQEEAMRAPAGEEAAAEATEVSW